MAGSIWSEVPTSGLVSVPMSLYGAVDGHTARSHQAQRDTAEPIRMWIRIRIRIRIRIDGTVIPMR
ncbi:hypothetical protein [Streptomyces hiroshimensis]|uniref:Uncharacterized protein n=1 Tax=Streptomyces hiroshimensis TaxID=66424 RepID=A0ABQ2YAB7_9ACTN|nr:hypothetical protein [Streptomyces hiroshimensis]GGX73425.1 hypothetical protein GCM10010324_18350 [Streptomyces hiroshimensis]